MEIEIIRYLFKSYIAYLVNSELGYLPITTDIINARRITQEVLRKSIFFRVSCLLRRKLSLIKTIFI